MTTAYVDSSCVVGTAFEEPGWKRVRRRLAGFGALYSSNLLEAEVRCAFVRESGAGDPSAWFDGIGWALPSRPLGQEMVRVLRAGHLRGADLWHLCCALYLAPDPRELAFLTLDDRQDRIARFLGFAR
ncbi:MAG: PIN domain-containing protein [Planctomycetes bacterium]|nr:PIN domain-containing protein [Planctomycetota bacterium]